MQIGDANQLFDLSPQFGFRSRVEDVQSELAQLLQTGPGFQFIDDCKGIELPHRGIGPQAFEGQVKLAVLDRQLVVREFEIPLQPRQECRLKNSALTVESVAREPYQFRFSKAQTADVLQ